MFVCFVFKIVGGNVFVGVHVVFTASYHVATIKKTKLKYKMSKITTTKKIQIHVFKSIFKAGLSQSLYLSTSTFRVEKISIFVCSFRHQETKSNSNSNLT